MKGISNKKLVEVAECVLRIIRIHNGMMIRCFSEKSQAYKNYGGRGITVCEEWKKLKPFIIWSLTHGYRNDLSIDRIDVNGNYEPSNCRWATIKQQQNNKRSNVFIVFKGRKKTFQEWCDYFGVERWRVNDSLKKQSHIQYFQVLENDKWWREHPNGTREEWLKFKKNRTIEV